MVRDFSGLTQIIDAIVAALIAVSSKSPQMRCWMTYHVTAPHSNVYSMSESIIWSKLSPEVKNRAA